MERVPRWPVVEDARLRRQPLQKSKSLKLRVWRTCVWLRGAGRIGGLLSWRKVLFLSGFISTTFSPQGLQVQALKPGNPKPWSLSKWRSITT